MNGLEIGARLVGIGLFMLLFGLAVDWIIKGTMKGYPDEEKPKDE